MRVAYSLDPIQLLITYSYLFTNISLEELADRVYRTDPTTKRNIRVSKQSIHQYVIRPIYEQIEKELEDIRMTRKIETLKKKAKYTDKYLLALDGATVTTGYTMFKNNVIVDNGIVKAKASMAIHERIACMQGAISDVIKKHQGSMVHNSIMFVTMEDYYMNGKANGAGSIYAFRGAIYALLNQFPRLVFLPEVSPQSWKAMYCKSNEKKEVIDRHIVKYLAKHMNMDEEYLTSVPADALESAAIGLYTLANNEHYNEITVG